MIWPAMRPYAGHLSATAFRSNLTALYLDAIGYSRKAVPVPPALPELADGIGSPGGAAKLGEIPKDHPIVAASPPQNP